MGYKVDLDLLDQRIAQMERFEAALDRELARLDEAVSKLHDTWSGLAAQAQRDAHERWRQGARDMRTALGGLRAAARMAHGNYHGAIEANRTMWERVQ
ncbi:WXG100 family type VII secretion target [Nocardioides panacisoli]|uniref:ESAT-6-like protein n=1 Tax=Nocardioides panacisoli TaxID=627624 RepID=A0ABP7J2P4_9ACTN